MRSRAAVIVACVVLAACGSGGASSSKTRPTVTVPTTPAPTTSTTRPQPTTTRPVLPTTTRPAAPAPLRLEAVGTGLKSPVAIAFRANDARMYVAEQGGRVRIVANGSVVTTPVLTLAVSHGDEQGLLGIAFSPDGSKLYTDITDPNGNTHVDEWTMHGDVADPKSRRELLYQPQPYPNHNGGEVLIGPDGMLYIGFGDGGSGGDPQNRAQNLGTWLGKILRINPNRDGASPYSVPADNPFVGRAGARHEIWMYGLRNPWRFSFDRATGATWIGDVGQDLYEEVDYAPPHTSGINWGWSAREGFHPYNSVTAPGARNPVLETTHHAGNCAIVGGYVYRGTAIAGLAGTYIFGDDCNPALMGVIANNGTLVRERALGLQVQSLTTFGEDQHGELYAASRTGTIYKLA